MMKKFNYTSKQEYTTPIIDVEELEKIDVLTDSVIITQDGDNISVQGANYFGGYDLMDEIFGR